MLEQKSEVDQLLDAIEEFRDLQSNLEFFDHILKEIKKKRHIRN